MRAVDPEAVGAVLAALRAEHPDETLSKLASLIDWPSLRRYNEPHEAYARRIYGEMEPL